MLLFLSVSSQSASAQNSVSWEDFVERMSDDGESGAENELFERLYEIHSQPINLNTATEEQLAELSFLSESQIKDLMSYIKKYGPMMSLGELMLILSFDAETRSFMPLFCFAGEPERKDLTFREAIKNGHNELVIRSDIPLYEKAGYKDYPKEVMEESPNKVYRGDKFHHSLRYSYNLRNKIELGITMDKDAGEKGIDFFSGYALLRNTGVIHTAAIGNYKASFGYGLVVNSGIRMGKTMTLSSVERMDRGISRHSSLSETGYYRGAALRVNVNDNIIASAFFSYKNEDGTFLSDSSGISSLKTDGLHRTKLENSKKGNISNTTFGGNISAYFGKLSISATGAFTRYSVALAPKCNTPSTYYRLYNARGNDFGAYSLAYSYLTSRIKLRGEYAISSEGGWATINSILIPIQSFNKLTIIHRYYGAKFVSVNGSSFGENSNPQNEAGIYIGWNYNFSRKMKLEAYVDGMYFPWLKYQVSDKSYGIECMAQYYYAPNQKLSFSARYKMKSKQRDFTIDEELGLKELRFSTSHNLRLQCNYSLDRLWTLKTTVSYQTRQSASGTTDQGFYIAESLRHNNQRGNRVLEFSLAYFKTDNYNSRLSYYEPTLLYSYGFTSLYYHGIRASSLINFNLTRNLQVTAKIGCTKYFNRSTIGTGLELIDANHKEYLNLQVRWKF